MYLPIYVCTNSIFRYCYMYLILWILFAGFRPNRCSLAEYTCNKTSDCIPMSKVCDGEKDCMTEDDESQALCCKYNLIFSSSWQAGGSLRYTSGVGIRTLVYYCKKIKDSYLILKDQKLLLIKKGIIENTNLRYTVEFKSQANCLIFQFEKKKLQIQQAWFVKEFCFDRAVWLEIEWLVS